MTQPQYSFMLGGYAAAGASLLTHPLDLTKVQMQTTTIKGRSVGRVMRDICSTYGVIGLYDGLSAALLRQLTYSTVRFGAYEYLKSDYLPPNPSISQLVAVSGIAGGIAGVVGVPTEVVLIRMTSDKTKPLAARYEYRNCFNGLYRITAHEGVAALYRGWGVNTLRAISMNASQLASYDYAKRILLRMPNAQDDVRLQLGASLIAGTVATTVCSPVDVLRSKIMASGKSDGEKKMLSVIRDAVRQEGPGFFFRGWTASWARLCPQTAQFSAYFALLGTAPSTHSGPEPCGSGVRLVAPVLKIQRLFGK